MKNWFGPFAFEFRPFYACAWLGPAGLLLRDHEAFPPIYSERNGGLSWSVVIGRLRLTLRRRTKL